MHRTRFASPVVDAVNAVSVIDTVRSLRGDAGTNPGEIDSVGSLLFYFEWSRKK